MNDTTKKPNTGKTVNKTKRPSGIKITAVRKQYPWIRDDDTLIQMSLSKIPPIDFSTLHIPKIDIDLHQYLKTHSLDNTEYFSALLAIDEVPEFREHLLSIRKFFQKFISNVATPVEITFLESICKSRIRDYNQNTTQPLSHLFAIIYATKQNIPEPSATVLYNAYDDFIDIAKQYNAGDITVYDYLTSIIFYTKIHGVGIACNTQADATSLIASIERNIIANESKAVLELWNKVKPMFTFDKAMSGFHINPKKDPSILNIMKHIYRATITQHEYDMSSLIIPMSLAQIDKPTTIVLINNEQLAMQKPQTIDSLIDFVRKESLLPPKSLTQTEIQKLKPLANAKMLEKRMYDTIYHTNGPRSLTYDRPLSDVPVTSAKLIKSIVQAYSTVVSTTRSKNSHRVQSKSLMKANRRNPNDPNIPGTITKQKQSPDFHVYLDTSGSITNENYESAIGIVCEIATKHNINIHFTSWATDISDPTHIMTKGKTKAQLIEVINDIHKVSGGTNITNVLQTISKNTENAMNLIITDMEFTANQSLAYHPKNTYYVAMEGINWERIKSNADRYIDSIKSIDPMIRNRFMF